MEKHKVLDLLLVELHRFLLILDKENLSGIAVIHKGLLADLLQSYRGTNGGGDEEYIYMNKVLVTGKGNDDKGDAYNVLANGKAAAYVPAPKKSLPDLPPPRTGVVNREPFPLPLIPTPACLDSVEGYYEEAQPYEDATNDRGDLGLVSGKQMLDSVVYVVITRDDGEAVSSSYESYDEEEVVAKDKCQSAQHQWPSAEASIELVKDANICAFLWRKKWLGQWAKQLCVIKDQRLLCYKSSKEQTPLLDVSLVGCSVVYKEKQLKRKEHTLKIIPAGGEAIVLGMQSKEQTEQWLRVIQEISPRSAESCEAQSSLSDSPRLICAKGELGERYSVASESGSSTDSHVETLDSKDVKKKHSTGLKFSNLMNIGKKKTSLLENPDKCVDTTGYLNVMTHSQWRSRWCLIKNGQLCFYVDKGRSKVSQPAVPLEGCSVVPDPSPEHLYSFRIDMDGVQLATLEAKSSADMGHWLGLLLSQTGTKMDPEDLTYDYVSTERISTIVNAAKASLYLMQRRHSEPNTYIDSLSSMAHTSEELYDDVASIGPETEDVPEVGLADSEDNSIQESNDLRGKDAIETESSQPPVEHRIYLDLTTVNSFLHGTYSGKTSLHKESPVHAPVPTEEPKELDSTNLYESLIPHPLSGTSVSADTRTQDQELPRASSPAGTQTQPQKAPSPVQSFVNRSRLLSTAGLMENPPGPSPHSPQPLRGRSTSGVDKSKSAGCLGAFEGKLGKNRTEAEVQHYADQRDRLEKEREDVKGMLGNLKKEKRVIKEELGACQDPKEQASLETSLKLKEEACREAELRRVEVELLLVEVKESLRKVEAGPFTLGTTLDSSHHDTAMIKVTTPAPSQAPMPQTQTTTIPCTTNSGEPFSPVNSATALKNRPASIMTPSKGNVLQKAKEWEKKSTT